MGTSATGAAFLACFFIFPSFIVKNIFWGDGAAGSFFLKHSPPKKVFLQKEADFEIEGRISAEMAHF